MDDDCVFCRIISGKAIAHWVTAWGDAIAITPLNPVVEGHTLIIPRVHVEDACTNPAITALTMARAAEYAPYNCNIITSVGTAATQTVMHLHVHVVPRHEGDGLLLPWSNQS